MTIAGLYLLFVCMCTHTCAARSARTVPPSPPQQEPIDIPDWAKIQPGTVTQNWKHFTRDGGHGVTFREYGAINYAVSVIGAARSRSQNHVYLYVRALLLARFYISHVHVYAAQGTPACYVARDFVNDRYVLLGKPRRLALTTTIATPGSRTPD